jgi:DNA polymerase delta subunit 4
MKQSTLSFAAVKRTASAGKPKVTSTPKPKTSLLVPRPTSKRKESSDEGIDEFDDIIFKDSSSEEIEEVGSDRSQPSKVDSTEVLKTKKLPLPATTNPGKEKGSEKGSDVETTPQPFKASNLKPEDLQKKVEANEIGSDTLPELDPSSERWNKLHKAAKAKLGGVPIHGKDDNEVQQILRVFDNSYDYGPCLGMTRLKRWERAESLGLNPPKEVHEILMTKQGQTLDEYKQSVFHGEV